MRKEIIAIIAAFVAYPAIALGDQASYDSELLEEHAVRLTLDGVSIFLRQFKPDASAEKTAKELIAQLGDPGFDVRQAAFVSYLNCRMFH